VLNLLSHISGGITEFFVKSYYSILLKTLLFRMVLIFCKSSFGVPISSGSSLSSVSVGSKKNSSKSLPIFLISSRSFYSSSLYFEYSLSSSTQIKWFYFEKYLSMINIKKSIVKQAFSEFLIYSSINLTIFLSPLFPNLAKVDFRV